MVFNAWVAYSFEVKEVCRYVKLISHTNFPVCYDFRIMPKQYTIGSFGGLNFEVKWPGNDSATQEIVHLGVYDGVSGHPAFADTITIKRNSRVQITMAKLTFKEVTTREKSYTWPKQTDLCGDPGSEVARPDCRNRCLGVAVAALCSCVLQGYELYFNESQRNTCTLADEGCLYETIEAVDAIGKKCVAKCKPPCEETTYHYTMVNSEMMVPGQGNEYWDKVTHVEIGFKSLSYKLNYEYESYESPEFVSNVGGQFGIWLCWSVLSLISMGLAAWVERQSRRRINDAA